MATHEHGGYRRGINWGLGHLKRSTISVPPPIAEEAKIAAFKIWIEYLEKNHWNYRDEDGVIHDLNHLRDSSKHFF